MIGWLDSLNQMIGLLNDWMVGQLELDNWMVGWLNVWMVKWLDDWMVDGWIVE